MAHPARLNALTASPPEPLTALSGGEDSRRSFLRMVSHELRTPLNSIIGFAEILNHELCGPLGSPQYKEYAGLIGSSGHRLLKLVNQILEIVRLEGGAEDLDIAPESVEAMAREVFAQMHDEAKAAGVRLAVEAPESLPDVMCDARAMRTVLSNLLHNAVRHAPTGSIVTVGARLFGGDVSVHVRDQGPGVEQQDLDRILRPFEQGGQTLTRHSEGAGLGLPIARLLCLAMKGGLELRSPPGEGLTALVTLPAA